MVIQNGDATRNRAADASSASLASSNNVTVVQLKKQINLFHAVCIIVGIIIGSGIFVSPVGILQNVKSVGMSCVMWAVCGVFSALCALCYAELGVTIPESGGEYTYIKRAFGDFPAFLAMWINFIIICPVCVAASCLIFATYILRPFFLDCDPPVTSIRLIAALVIGEVSRTIFAIHLKENKYVNLAPFSSSYIDFVGAFLLYFIYVLVIWLVK